MSEPSYLAAVRESYDTVADAYAEQVPRPADLDPLSRAVLGMFAETVREAGLGPLADLGCGPGHVTAHLAALGATVFGVDLSPRMADLARRTHPDLPFTVGSMTALGIGTGTLGGILAHYSTHHTPPRELPVLYAEFHRTLAPGGLLMLSGHAGDNERTRPTHAYGGHPVSYESHLLPAERLTELLQHAGLTVTARIEQDPGKGTGRTYVTLLARKPPAAGEKG
ncbi:methyltransferase domain-containing protein [Streptomyces sp. NPDC048324]|uniref:class I SAM-dependent DNA methyltransferase n=1 Tax=Streptomyces sp. NPDC048324 TaxID=3157205 RepID=UPI00342C86FE